MKLSRILIPIVGISASLAIACPAQAGLRTAEDRHLKMADMLDELSDLDDALAVALKGLVA